MRHPSPSPTTSVSGGPVVLNHQQTDSRRIGGGATPASTVCDSGLGSSAGGVGQATTATPTPAG